eukprot:CAMPEP_0185781206 /NCGR_PEP_ID=MMETSP1174-20130828/101555_1 /TAXON_ID=35687 /ORGANISM="Dictyocha speculum, Strain CCMP1381" /LENGTH=63 /DNA_ID=CAMNT_0028471091 /DNA_START=77 /DNA_END=265 /DNA_ORIENTATION=-
MVHLYMHARLSVFHPLGGNMVLFGEDITSNSAVSPSVDEWRGPFEEQLLYTEFTYQKETGHLK